MKTMETLFESVKTSEYVTKLADLKTQIDTIITTSKNEAMVAQEVAALRKLPEIMEVAAFFNKTLTAWNSIDSRGIRETLKNVTDWDLAKEIQKTLDSTGLLKALTDIKNMKFDGTAIDSFVNFADKIRTIQSKAAEVTGTKTFLADLTAVVTAGNAAKSSTQLAKTRKRRQTPQLDSFMTHQLGSAVQVLQNMAMVSEKKGKMLGLVNAKASVTTAVEAVAKDVWTAENRDAMKNTVDEVEKLENFVQKLSDDDWDTLVKVFDEAAKVKGVSIDSKMFADPIGVTLEKSTDSDVKAAAVDFRDLSTLDLDFASKERDLKTASLTLNPIRDFFDQLLGTSGVKEVKEVVYVTEEPASNLWMHVVIGILVAVIIIGGAAVIFCCLKNKKGKKEGTRLVEDEESKKKSGKKDDEAKEQKKESEGDK